MEKQKKTSKSRLLKIAVCLFVVYIAYSIVVQQLEIRDRKITLEAVQQQCQQQIEENKEVERLLAMVLTKITLSGLPEKDWAMLIRTKRFISTVQRTEPERARFYDLFFKGRHSF